jgi:hypothetical protein
MGGIKSKIDQILSASIKDEFVGGETTESFEPFGDVVGSGGPARLSQKTRESLGFPRLIFV